MDPRVKGISMRLQKIGNIIPVVSGKGGVGKSLFSVSLALSLRSLGFPTGLLDMDFHGASDHLVLGLKNIKIPDEERGVRPPEYSGIKFMSIVYYTADNPLPLRGNEISNALIELLSITRWGNLDYLVIDMPPGLGDPFLDLLRYLKMGRYVVITTPSVMAINVAEKVIKMLLESHLRVEGIVENMSLKTDDTVRNMSRRYSIDYLGRIPFYQDIDDIIGDPEKIMKHEFGKKVVNIASLISAR